jgi:hypothetical protein
MPEERADVELPTADVPTNAKDLLPEAMDEAIYSYARAVELGKASDKEYARHIKLYTTNAFLYQSHRDDLKGMELICAADEDYLKGIRATSPDQRKALFDAAAKSYVDAIHQYQLILLQYYTTDQAAEKLFPKGYTRTNISNLPPQQYGRILDGVMALMRTTGEGLQNQEDMSEYLRYIERASRRLHLIDEFNDAHAHSTPATQTQP